MKLAIADPPYPPNYLAASRANGHGPPLRATRIYSGGRGVKHLEPADYHPDAAVWNNLDAHRELLATLVEEFDGWAIATTPDAVAAGVYAPLPYATRVLAWIRPNALPVSQSRIQSMWESVLLYTPEGRRGRTDTRVLDYLIAAPPNIGFAGAKPRQWTRWVLDALGYDPDVDDVVDMFPGSGAVSAEIAQGVLL